MAFGFIKSTQNVGTAGTSTIFTIPAARVGSLLVVSMKFTTVVSAVSVTDNASIPNTYAAAAGPIGTGAVTAFQFYGVQVTGGATQVTVSWTTSATLRATIDEFSGGMQTNATVFDKVATNNGTGTSASVTLAPTNNGELVVATINLNNGATSLVIGTNYLAGTSGVATTEYRKVSTTSETAPLSWTTSVTWAEIAGAYIPIDTSANFFQVL